MITITKFTASRPDHLSKKFTLRSGKLEKESGCKLIEGIAEKIGFDGIRGLVTLQNSLNSKQALAYSINGHDMAWVVPKGVLATATHPKLPVIARDREHFNWPEGAGIAFLDYDAPDGQEPLGRDQLLELLYAQWPALRTGPHLWRPSASSCIFDSRDDKELRGIAGQHIYANVKEPADLSRAGQVLIGKLWLAGHGWIKISESGAPLLRSPVDAMFQPERLDFAGGAQCEAPLEQRLPEPLLLNPDAEPIDTRMTLPDLTEAEQAEVARLQAEAKAAKAQEAAEVRARWMEARVGELAKRHPGVPGEELREVLQQAVEGQMLTSKFVLYDARKRPVTVAAMLANPGEWHGKYIRDPLEPGYSSSAAWVCLDDKGTFLYSHAHGLAVRYELRDTDRMFADEPDAEANGDEGDGEDRAEAEGGAGELLKAAIEQLAKLDPLAYDRVRKAEAQRLGVRVNTLDDAVAAARKRMGLDDADEDGKQGKAIEFEEVEPWPSTVDGAQLLDDLVSIIRRFVVLPPHGAEAMALWIAHTYLLDAAEHTPRLVLSSPVLRCGKSTTFDMMAELVHRPQPAASVTPAAMFRLIEAYAPCIMLDELDALLEKDQTGDIRGLINAGHSRAAAKVIRTVGEDFEPRSFSVWAPMAMALIGSLEKRWGTVADRAVVIPMQRKSPSVRLPRLRSGKKEFAQLRRQIVRWADDHKERLQGAEPDMPEALNDRAADNWRPLFAIAAAVGGTWPEKARKAALGLSGSEAGVSVEADGAGVRLLSDIRGIFTELSSDRITTAELIQKLTAIDDPEAPWAEWNSRSGWMDKQIKARQIAKLLKPFGIKPGTVRLPDDTTPKGYMRKDFEAAFASYLPAAYIPSPGNG